MEEARTGDDGTEEDGMEEERERTDRGDDGTEEDGMEEERLSGLSATLLKQAKFGKKCYEMTDEFLLGLAPGHSGKRRYEMFSKRQAQAAAASRETRLAVTPWNVPGFEGATQKDKIIGNLGNYLHGNDGMFYHCIIVIIC